MSATLITATDLAHALESATPPRVLDCRARLGDPAAGERLWRQGHLPGSHHLDLDRDLAAPAGAGGRHPLPTADAFTGVVQRCGITAGQTVVVYDDMGGQLAAARAWWMLACWAGHPDVRVLDGGLEAWRAEGRSLDAGDASAVSRSAWRPVFEEAARVDAEALLAGKALALDARSRDRFRGEAEPIDPVAGHIPGAVCRPSAENLTAEGVFKAPEVLAAELPRDEAVIAYCGSGVTACHTILAYAVAGLPLPRLYAGSWSEWIREPSRPVATGD